MEKNIIKIKKVTNKCICFKDYKTNNFKINTCNNFSPMLAARGINKNIICSNCYHNRRCHGKV